MASVEGAFLLLLEVPLDDGTTILVEIDQPDVGPVKVGREQVVARAAQTLQDALDPIIRMATGVTDKLRESDPGQISVAFGVKFTAESGVILSKISAEANLTVTVQWDRTKFAAR
ncbi:CU044_2847 family protein [Micromonospora ureilytica]|uniref:Trypsin-co-occurring domain-containing protein n=1 Tax=Micromonospora ureilytica TaxID=709868 RepID=A0ABS0JA37_9ACTN|nr:CU044_2847 family protein [Micromonospora ureilytica]MBG6063912.1 hypothetical protein [Micromonospora ureilytica]